VPYIATAGEIKTKPTQHSVKELRSIGIQPDILVCRSEQPIPEAERAKIALFTNVSVPDVFSLPDAGSIYEIPLILQKEGLGDRVTEKLGISVKNVDLTEWEAVVLAQKNPEHQVRIAMVGKYIDFADSYKSLIEAITHAGIHTHCKVHIDYIDAEELVKHGTKKLESAHAILVPGGFGVRGVEGKILAAQYAREKKIPYLGICLGLQIAVIEYARHKLGLIHANSTEFEQNCKDPVIALVSEWESLTGEKEQRREGDDLGGTMRLGGQNCLLSKNSLAEKCYGKNKILERHRHRYEVNANYVERLKKAGIIVSGVSEDGKLVEMIELADHPWFLACQFHPEFTSSPRDGHPLFTGFIEAALKKSENATTFGNTHENCQL
jgi:CTP synthase